MDQIFEKESPNFLLPAKGLTQGPPTKAPVSRQGLAKP